MRRQVSRLIWTYELFERKAMTSCSTQQGQPRCSWGPKILWVLIQPRSCFPKLVFFVQPICLFDNIFPSTLLACLNKTSLLYLPLFSPDILHSYIEGIVLSVIVSSCTQRLFYTEMVLGQLPPDLLILHMDRMPFPVLDILALPGSLALLFLLTHPLLSTPFCITLSLQHPAFLWTSPAWPVLSLLFGLWFLYSGLVNTIKKSSLFCIITWVLIPRAFLARFSLGTFSFRKG